MSLSLHAPWHDALGAIIRPPRPPLRVWPTLALWRERRRTRQQFSTLDDRALADVGLSRMQQRIECSKSHWQS